jgi:hypothetical protein
MDRLIKAVACGIVLFAVVLAAFVGVRVDQVTLALLGGMFIGTIIAIPCTLAGAFLFMKQNERKPSERAFASSAPMPQSPPQFWVMPNQTPAVDPRLQLTQSNLQIPTPTRLSDFNTPSPRRFYMIGETGEMQEIEASSNESGFQVVAPQFTNVGS